MDTFWRMIEKVDWPEAFYKIPRPLVLVTAFLFHVYTYSYIGMTFMLKNFERVSKFHSAFDSWPNLALPVFCAISMILPKKKRESVQTRQKTD
jgi:hypothetical protein